MAAETEYYVEIEVPRGDTTTWEVVGPRTDLQTATDLYNHFLDLGMQVRITTWSLKVVRQTPAHPDARPSTVESSVLEVDTELRKSGIRLPTVQDLVAKVQADLHAAEMEVEHLATKGEELIGELVPGHPHQKNPGQEDAAEQQPTEKPIPVPAAEETSPDIPAVTSVDLMPGDPGYIQHMLKVSRSDLGTRVSRQMG